MKVAVLGAGFSGLSAAWHLLAKRSCEIVIYDPKGIGGGASGIATGLMHPYAGEQGRRSLFATEAIKAAKDLIALVEENLGCQIIIQQGILRYIQNDEQKQMFFSHQKNHGDVIACDDRSFWIESGMTIDCSLYLEGLWQMIATRGARLERTEISTLKSLDCFDHVIVAAGAGIKKFPELHELKSSVLRGQVLTCHVPEEVSLPPVSSLCKGYLALARDKETCYVGSTYERGNLTEIPDEETAKSLLFDKVGFFFPEITKLSAIDCKAALRVVRKGHYFPLVGCVKDGLWVLTALGSRGLLYHAYLGDILAEAILADVRIRPDIDPSAFKRVEFSNACKN